MPTGKLLSWNVERGFGFFSDDSGHRNPNVFVHISAFQLAALEPVAGHYFSYSIEEYGERTRAAHIQSLGSCSDAD